MLNGDPIMAIGILPCSMKGLWIIDISIVVMMARFMGLRGM